MTGTLYGSQPIPVEGTMEGNTLRVTLKVPTASGSELETGRLPVFGPAGKEFTAKRVN